MYFSLGSNKSKLNFLDIYSRDNDINKLNNDNCFNFLKKAYTDVISGFVPINISNLNKTAPFLKTNDDEQCDKLCEGYNMSRLDDLSQSDIIKNATYNVSDLDVNEYLKCLDFLKEQSEDLYEVFSLAINALFFMRSDQASGGSTSGLPGVIWINPKEHWTRSAVLNKNRPLDKSFHSAVVGTEVILYRDETGIFPEVYCAHPPTPKLLDQTLFSIKSCLDSSLIYPRGKYILETCREKLESL